ncbi:aminoacyl-tRNA hydrolase [Candidatus Gottesmanbacteria bacterium]|nr:aminoacyl-tRNA hydrolase [Candidatus Gottesmanbacteria bacterium]
MKLIIGLGNPGEKYKFNRHNAGHMFVEWAINNGQWAIKSDVFMNDSGEYVKKNLTNWTNLTNLFIAHDDLDIPLGKYKIQFGVGPKVHNGILSIENSLKTKDFWRIRIGVDSRQQDSRLAGERFVLENFTDEELKVLQEVYAKIGHDLKRL